MAFDENPRCRADDRAALDSGKDGKVTLGKDEEQTKTWFFLQQHYQQFHAAVGVKDWVGANELVKQLRTDFAQHEQATQSGKKSAAAQALLTEAEKENKAGAAQLANWQKREKAPSFKRLDDALGKASRERAEYEKLFGVSVANGCSTRGGKACDIQRRESAADQALDALGKKYGVQRPGD